MSFKVGNWVKAYKNPPSLMGGGLGLVTGHEQVTDKNLMHRTFVVVQWGPGHTGSHLPENLRHAEIVDAIVAQDRYERTRPW